MSLVTTVREPIYRGDNLNQKITYLIPENIGEIDMLTATTYLNFLRADGEPDVVMLERSDEMYQETFYQYVLPVTCKLSRYAGAVVTWLQIYTGDISDPVVAKSGENIIQILESKDIDGYVGDWRSDKVLTALYQMKAQTDEAFDETNEKVEQNATAIAELCALVAVKADNLIFDDTDNSLQLTSGGEPVGDKIIITAATGKSITSVSLTTSGELVVFFTDGTYENVGKVVGDDGRVYVPHIDAHKVLTFTIEDAAGEIPDPVDLNPDDEWSGIDGTGGETDYTWEGISGDGDGDSGDTGSEWQTGI